MSDLGGEIRRAVNNGLLHLSLHQRWDGKVWMAGYRNTDNHNVQYAEDPDWEKALLKAIRAGVRDVKRQPKTEPPSSDQDIKAKRDVKRQTRSRDAEDLI